MALLVHAGVEEVERARRGEKPRECYRGDAMGCLCGTGKGMSKVCERCPWEYWAKGDSLPPAPKDGHRG